MFFVTKSVTTQIVLSDFKLETLSWTLVTKKGVFRGSGRDVSLKELLTKDSNKYHHTRIPVVQQSDKLVWTTKEILFV